MDLCMRFEVHPAQNTTSKRDFLEPSYHAFGYPAYAPKHPAFDALHGYLYSKVEEHKKQPDIKETLS